MQIDFFDKQPSRLTVERILRRKGFHRVGGLDEVGRGAMAGPVVAAVVCLPESFLESKLPIELAKVKDSKLLTARQREFIFREVDRRSDVQWGVGVVPEKTIDRINILEATKRAMMKAVDGLPDRPDLLVLDGDFELPTDLTQVSVVGADRRIFSVALASIMAKVFRDRLMLEYHALFPEYGFDRHKGYGTRFHKEAFARHGPSPIHRLSFGTWQKD